MRLFFELIQTALGKKERLSVCPSDEEWQKLFSMCQKQAIAGFAFEALECLSQNGQKPPFQILYEWIGLSEQLKKQNQTLNHRCQDIFELLEDDGLKGCILKGQGNALMYPHPFSRQPGDIDVWIDADKDTIMLFVNKHLPDTSSKTNSIHVDFPIFPDVSVEIHFEPTYSITRRHQKSLEMFMGEVKAEQFDHPVKLEASGKALNVPTIDFNLIYQLSHIQRHFFYGGVGFRHVIDYYYVLSSKRKWGRKDIEMSLSILGLRRFAGALMWIMKEILCMDDELLIAVPDEKRGRLLFDEIMKGGNFGHHDQRKMSKLRRKSATLSVIAQNMRKFRLFPEEAISAPITGLIRRYL